MPVRLGVSTNKKQGKNTTTEEDNNNNNGAEQPFTIQERLERRPEKTCFKKYPWAKKAGNLGRNHSSRSSNWQSILRRLYKGKDVDSAVKYLKNLKEKITWNSEQG